MENLYLLITFLLAIVVLLILLFVSQLDCIKLRGELAKAEIHMRFLKRSVIIRDWHTSSLKIYAALLKNGYSSKFIGSSSFQEMLMKEFELFDQIRLFNPETEFDPEIMRMREFYAS